MRDGRVKPRNAIWHCHAQQPRASPLVTPHHQAQPMRLPCEPQARGRAQPIRQTCSAPHLQPPRRCVVPQRESCSFPESMPLHPVPTGRDGFERMSVEAPHRRRRQKVMPPKAVMRFCCLPPAGKVFGSSQGSETHESLCSPPKLGSERAESRVSERLAFLVW